MICNRCRMPASPGSRYCTYCGTATLTGSSGAANVKGAFAGMAAGTVVAMVFMGFGALMCLTGIGAIIGVPFILIGLIMPMIGGAKGLTTKPIQRFVGSCPWCGYRATGCAPGFNCPSCAHRIMVRGNVFSKAPTS
jgi:hypothetical protein